MCSVSKRCLHCLHVSVVSSFPMVPQLVYVNVIESFSRLVQEFDKVMGKYSPSTGFPEHPTLEKLLQVCPKYQFELLHFPRRFSNFSFLLKVLNMSWKQETLELQDAMTADLADPTGGSVNVNGQIWRWWGTVIHRVILVSPMAASGTLFSFFLGGKGGRLSVNTRSDSVVLIVSYTTTNKRTRKHNTILRNFN